MPESVPPARPAVRRPGPAADRPIVLSVGGEVTVTVVSIAKSLTTKEVKNSLERAVRLAGRAVTAGLDLNAFLTLLETLAEADRLDRAAREAGARVAAILDGSRVAPAPEPAPEPLSMSSP